MAIYIKIMQPVIKTEINLDNADDVFDVVMDAHARGTWLNRDLIEDIATAMYRDRRGGPLDELWNDDRFETAFNKQYAYVVRGV